MFNIKEDSLNLKKFILSSLDTDIRNGNIPHILIVEDATVYNDSNGRYITRTILENKIDDVKIDETSRETIISKYRTLIFDDIETGTDKAFEKYGSIFDYKTQEEIDAIMPTISFIPKHIKDYTTIVNMKYVHMRYENINMGTLFYGIYRRFSLELRKNTIEKIKAVNHTSSIEIDKTNFEASSHDMRINRLKGHLLYAINKMSQSTRLYAKYLTIVMNMKCPLYDMLMSNIREIESGLNIDMFGINIIESADMDEDEFLINGSSLGLSTNKYDSYMHIIRTDFVEVANTGSNREFNIQIEYVKSDAYDDKNVMHCILK